MSIKIALTGNPNCGKTMLFSSLVGSNQSVGNWPDIVVEKKEDKLKGSKGVIIMDLPGIYSLSPYTLEEVVARSYLITERPDAILNIVDGTSLERNLYLTTQLVELETPVLMAVNMMDVIKKSGDQISIQALSGKLGYPVVEISALKGAGIMETTNKAVESVRDSGAAAAVHKFPADVEAALGKIERCIGGNMPEAQKCFYVIKLFEQDGKITVQMTTAPDVGSIIARMEDAADDDTKSVTTSERYTYITSIIGRCYTKKSREKINVSNKIDYIVTNRFLALPIFAAIM